MSAAAKREQRTLTHGRHRPIKPGAIPKRIRLGSMGRLRHQLALHHAAEGGARNPNVGTGLAKAKVVRGWPDNTLCSTGLTHDRDSYFQGFRSRPGRCYQHRVGPLHVWPQPVAQLNAAANPDAMAPRKNISERRDLAGQSFNLTTTSLPGGPRQDPDGPIVYPMRHETVRTAWRGHLSKGPGL